MAWSSLSSNQMVSYTDAQGGGFTLNSGQSHVTSNQCMTKDQALAKYNLSSSSMSAYSSNQLVPKSAWVSGLPYIMYTRTIGFNTASEACSHFADWAGNAYQQITTGRFFADAALSTPFNGNFKWFLFYDNITGNTANLLIDNSGYISNSYDCLF